MPVLYRDRAYERLSSRALVVQGGCQGHGDFLTVLLMPCGSKRYFIRCSKYNCIELHEVLGENGERETPCYGLAEAHFKSLQHKLPVRHCAKGLTLAFGVFSLSLLIVAFSPLGEKVKHNYRVHCSSSSLEEHFPVLVAYSQAMRGVLRILWKWMQGFSGQPEGPCGEHRLRRGARC